MYMERVNKKYFVKTKGSITDTAELAHDKAMMSTPWDVAHDMINMLPESTWDNPDIKVLDPVCKSGIFLHLAFEKLYEHNPFHIKNGLERSVHILSKCLYAIGLEEICALQTRRLMYGSPRGDGNYGYVWKSDFGRETLKGNIRAIQETEAGKNIHYTDICRKAKKIVDEHGNTVEITGLEHVMLEAFGGSMKFDVVIGNPPYNKGMDLDFVDLAYKLVKDKTGKVVMIIPAKWQAGVTDSSLQSKLINYEQFRKIMVPHMSHVVFYPNSNDVFNILANSGITYFLIDTNIHNECTVVNKWSSFPEYYNSVETRSIVNGEMLCNVGNHVIQYIKGKAFNYIRTKSSSKQYVVWGTAAMPMFLHYKPNDNSAHYMTSDLKIDESKNINLSSDSFIFFESDSVDECKSFVSYMYTKTVRFLISCNILIYKGWNKAETFKFVPAPPAVQEGLGANPWDHIYTDDELYKYFGLPQEYIDVIEAVIKERK